MKKLTLLIIISIMCSCGKDKDNDNSEICKKGADNSGDWTPVEFRQINNYDWRVDFDREAVVFDWWQENVLIRDFGSFYDFTEYLFDYNESFPYTVTDPLFDWSSVPASALAAAQDQALSQSCLKIIEEYPGDGHLQVKPLSNINRVAESPVKYPIPTTQYTDTSGYGWCGPPVGHFRGYSVVYDYYFEELSRFHDLTSTFEEKKEKCRKIFDNLRGEEGSFMLQVSIFADLSYSTSFPYLQVISVEESGWKLKIKLFPILGPTPTTSMDYFSNIAYADAYISLPDKYRNYQFGFELLTDPEACPATDPPAE